jgi:hypothetical protein
MHPSLDKTGGPWLAFPVGSALAPGTSYEYILVHTFLFFYFWHIRSLDNFISALFAHHFGSTVIVMPLGNYFRSHPWAFLLV